ncbi:MAG: hypothetical protein WD059_05260 [Balneolaceae bacterium]
MNKFNRYISVVIFTASILGLLLSMAHYHSSGLKCLDHVEEQHYTENELLCSVCGITVFSEPITQPAAGFFIVFESNLTEIEELFLSAHPFLLLSDRAPPFMA